MRSLVGSPRLTRTETVHYILTATKELAELLGLSLKEVGIDA